MVRGAPGGDQRAIRAGRETAQAPEAALGVDAVRRGGIVAVLTCVLLGGGAALAAEAPGTPPPPILRGWFPAFRASPGPEVADPDVFRSYVFEVARSLVQQGARRIVF